MKRICLCAMLAVILCFVSSCGNSGTEERLKTGEEQALEQKEKAEDAVDAVNEQTNQLNQNAQSIDEE